MPSASSRYDHEKIKSESFLKLLVDCVDEPKHLKNISYLVNHHKPQGVPNKRYTPPNNGWLLMAC
jgi:hypothetical protein